MDKWAKFDLTIHTIHTNDNALLAYVDLCGTEKLYKDDVTPLKDVARRLYNALLDSFINALMNEYSNDEIKDGLYINIYADSIMVCVRKKDQNAVKRLLKMLLYFQWLLILEHKAIPFRAIVARDRYFSLHIDPASISDKHVLKSKYVDVSLCGGRGIIALDERLRGLPIGTYVEDSLINNVSFDKKRLVKVEGETLFFVKQDQDHIISLMSDNDLERVVNSDIPFIRVDKDRYFPDCHEKWEQWILAHEGKIETIRRTSKREKPRCVGH